MPEPDESAKRDRNAGRTRVAWVVGSLLLTLLILCGGLAAYVAAVNRVPPYSSPSAALPVPNAFDDFATAVSLVHETSEAQSRTGYVPPTAALRKSAAANLEAIARLRAGFQHEYLTPPLYNGSPTFPGGAGFRSMARVLCAEGLLHEREGCPAEAVRCYLDTVRFGATIPRGGSLIHWLTGNAIQSTGLANLQRSLDQLDAHTARHAARELLRIDKGGTTTSDALLSTTEWEAAEMTAIFHQLRTPRDYQQFVSVLIRPGSATSSDTWKAVCFALTPKTQIIRNYRAYMTHLADSYRQPYYARGTLPSAPDDLYNQTLDQVFRPAAFAGDKEEALVRIVAVQLAARAYTLEHGSPPPNAQALVPQYLDRVPNDPFAPRPITLKIKDGKALVYSVGPDGVDDGGKGFKGVISPTSKGDYLTVRAQK